VGEREGLIGRVRQIRRIMHLERLVQGLQDSVHRESTRLGRRIGEVETRIAPAALGRALSDGARARGL